jgi:hypothetical protein
VDENEETQNQRMERLIAEITALKKTLSKYQILADEANDAMFIHH